MAGIGHVSGARLEHALAAYLAVGVLKANAQLNWQMDVGNTTAGDMELMALTDFRQPGEVVLRVMLDIIVYVLMVAWLSFKAWQVVLPPCVPLAPVDCRPLLARARLSLFLALPLYERVSIKACLHQGLSTSRPVYIKACLHQGLSSTASLSRPLCQGHVVTLCPCASSGPQGLYTAYIQPICSLYAAYIQRSPP